jgi:hypothetical protein
VSFKIAAGPRQRSYIYRPWTLFHEFWYNFFAISIMLP